ncbi:MAG: hypothetical protein DRQ02_02625 [Candidatus Latescibacterota bacterium]|nr:MAG: hypothetical protein DRQ02_02625 [Candidatus Latescibacterota bacterium]
MPEELQPGASTVEPGAMPEGQAAPEKKEETEVKLIPESDLRALQSKLDKRQAELTKQAETARREAEAARLQLQTLRASMDTLARQTMDPKEAENFIAQQEQQGQMAELQRDAILYRRRQFADNLAEQYGIPTAEFNSVINNPTATEQDALKVVSDYLAKQKADWERQQREATQNAQVVAEKQERQVRSANGSDKIGTPAEPASGSPDLRAQYDKKAKEIVTQSWARPRVKDWAGELRKLKEEYRALGLEV